MFRRQDYILDLQRSVIHRSIADKATRFSGIAGHTTRKVIKRYVRDMQEKEYGEHRCKQKEEVKRKVRIARGKEINDVEDEKEEEVLCGRKARSKIKLKERESYKRRKASLSYYMCCG